MGSSDQVAGRIRPAPAHLGPVWSLGCHTLACWLGGLGLGSLSCLAGSSYYVLGSGLGLLSQWARLMPWACCRSGLGLMPWACCGSCQVLGLLPVGLEMDMGFLPRVWRDATLQRRRRWNLCCCLVASSCLLGHGGDGCATAPWR